MILELLIGYQISFYFLYQYYKIKEEKIGLNKILLAFSLLFGLGVSGIVIRNYNSYYINDVLLNNFFLYFTHVIIAVAVSSFLLIISSKSFQIIININITRAVSIYTILISILIFVVQIKSIQFIFFIISIILGYFYLIFFHLKLINRSKGKIRKRIILIFIGEVLLISNILIGSEETVVLIFQQHMPFITLISNFVILFALMTILLCVYKFPIFLEFNWDKNLIKLFIVNTQNFEIIYTFNFTEEIERKENTTKKPSETIESDYFFSRGIIGIKDIISGITNKKEEGIEKIRRGELLILLKNGDAPLSFVLYCLTVKKEMNSINYFLKTIKNEFQELYKNIILSFEDLQGLENKIFSSFDNHIKNIIS
jgi:hypothetical protein